MGLQNLSDGGRDRQTLHDRAILTLGVPAHRSSAPRFGCLRRMTAPRMDFRKVPRPRLFRFFFRELSTGHKGSSPALFQNGFTPGCSRKVRYGPADTLLRPIPKRAMTIVSPNANDLERRLPDLGLPRGRGPLLRNLSQQFLRHGRIGARNLLPHQRSPQSTRSNVRAQGRSPGRTNQSSIWPGSGKMDLCPWP
jgi:hypothetical protein